MESRSVRLNRSSPSRIIVCVRLRPVIEEDNLQAHKSKNDSPDICVHLKSDGQTVKLCRDLYSANLFNFDHTFPPSISQSEAYNLSMSKIVHDFINGYNGMCMVYGQTGSGKSYTMFGSSKQPGLAQLALDDIFTAVVNQEENNLLGKVYISFYQIYVEQIYDLLVEQKGSIPLQIREDSKRGVHVDNLQLMFVKDRQTAHDLLEYGLKGRRTQSTSQNMQSSRSHAVLQFHIDFELPNEFSSPTARDGNEQDSELYGTIYQKRHTVRRSVLTLVDLAGSERVKHYSRAISKQQFKEAVIINKSISSLGNCIQALANNHFNAQNGQSVNNSFSSNLSVSSSIGSLGAGSSTAATHVPYRDCKLTRLLAEPLGGNSKTVIIANIGPCQCNAEETLSTLKFATRAMVVRKQVRKEALHEVIERLPHALPSGGSVSFGLPVEDGQDDEEEQDETNLTTEQQDWGDNADEKTPRSPASRLDDYEGDEEEGEEDDEDDETAEYLRANTSSRETPRVAPSTVSYLASVAADRDAIDPKTTFNLREFLASCQKQQVGGFHLMGETVSPTPAFQQSAIDRFREVNPNYMRNLAMLPLAADSNRNRHRRSFREDSESASGLSTAQSSTISIVPTGRDPPTSTHSSPRRVVSAKTTPLSVSPTPRTAQPEWQSSTARLSRPKSTAKVVKQKGETVSSSVSSSKKSRSRLLHDKINSPNNSPKRHVRNTADKFNGAHHYFSGDEERKASWEPRDAQSDMYNHLRRDRADNTHQITRKTPNKVQSSSFEVSAAADVNDAQNNFTPQQTDIKQQDAAFNESVVNRSSNILFDDSYSPIRPQFHPRRTRTHSEESRGFVGERSPSPVVGSPVARSQPPPKMFSPLMLSGSYDQLVSELNKVCDDAVTQLSVGKPKVSTPSSCHREGSTSTADRLSALSLTPLTVTNPENAFSPKRTPVIRTHRSFLHSVPVDPQPPSILVTTTPVATSPTSAKTARSSPSPRAVVDPAQQDEAEEWYAAQRERSQLTDLVSRLRIRPEEIVVQPSPDEPILVDISRDLDASVVGKDEIDSLMPDDSQVKDGLLSPDNQKSDVEVAVDQNNGHVLKSSAALSTAPVQIATENNQSSLQDEVTPSVSSVQETLISASTLPQLQVDTSLPKSPLFAVKSKRKAPPTPVTLVHSSPIHSSHLAHFDSVKPARSSPSSHQRRHSRSGSNSGNSSSNRSVEEARIDLLKSFSRERLVVMIVQLQDELASKAAALTEKEAEIQELKKYILEM